MRLALPKKRNNCSISPSNLSIHPRRPLIIIVMSSTSLSFQSQTLFASVEDCLHQISCLLESLSDEQYSLTMPEAMNASIGGHVRHSLDHFSAILDGCNSGAINYDSRLRDTSIETSTDHAEKRTTSLRETFRLLDPNLVSRDIEVTCKVNQSESPAVESTIGRELMFAVIHAVHHNALISFMLNCCQVQTPAGFGVAPSTTAYRCEQT